MKPIKPILWIYAVLSYAIGDILTTYYGLFEIGLTERSPLAYYLLTTYGFWSFVVVKFSILLLAYASYCMAEHYVNEEDTPIAAKVRLTWWIPIYLTLLGTAILINNIYFIQSVL